MAAILKRVFVALFLLAIIGSSFAQNGSASFKHIFSETDFWKQFTPKVRLYTDDSKIAPASEMAQLNRFLKGSPHHWFVILLKHIDGDAFVSKLQEDLVDNPAFQKLTDGETPDANVVLIARLSTWTKAHPHYSIQVYTGPWMEQRDLGADGENFYNSILPAMKKISNAKGPAAGARIGIETFDEVAKREAALPTFSDSESSDSSPINLFGAANSLTSSLFPVAAGFVLIVFSACFIAASRTTADVPGPGHYNWGRYNWDPASNGTAINPAMADLGQINQAGMNQHGINQELVGPASTSDAMPTQPPTQAPAVPEVSPIFSDFDTRGGGTWGRRKS